MANVRRGNSYYADTTGSITCTGNPIRLTHILKRSGGVASNVTLSDGSSTKFVIYSERDSQVQFFDFSSNPVVFSTSLNVSALSNCSLTLVFSEG